jgi:hypothetical protein
MRASREPFPLSPAPGIDNNFPTGEPGLRIEMQLTAFEGEGAVYLVQRSVDAPVQGGLSRIHRQVNTGAGNFGSLRSGRRHRGREQQCHAERRQEARGCRFQSPQLSCLCLLSQLPNKRQPSRAPAKRSSVGWAASL